MARNYFPNPQISHVKQLLLNSKLLLSDELRKRTDIIEILFLGSLLDRFDIKASEVEDLVSEREKLLLAKDETPTANLTMQRTVNSYIYAIFEKAVFRTINEVADGDSIFETNVSLYQNDYFRIKADGAFSQLLVKKMDYILEGDTSHENLFVDVHDSRSLKSLFETIRKVSFKNVTPFRFKGIDEYLKFAKSMYDKRSETNNNAYSILDEKIEKPMSSFTKQEIMYDIIHYNTPINSLQTYAIDNESKNMALDKNVYQHIKYDILSLTVKDLIENEKRYYGVNEHIENVKRYFNSGIRDNFEMELPNDIYEHARYSFYRITSRPYAKINLERNGRYTLPAMVRIAYLIELFYRQMVEQNISVTEIPDFIQCFYRLSKEQNR